MVITGILQDYVGSNTVNVGLAAGGVEVSAAGYRRVQLEPADWTHTERGVRSRQSFGPYTGAVEFDGVNVYNQAGVLLGGIPLGGVTRLGPGVKFENLIDLAATADG